LFRIGDVGREEAGWFEEYSDLPVHILCAKNKRSPKNIVDPNNHGLSLLPGRTYCWKVDTVFPDSSIVSGQTWFFTAQTLQPQTGIEDRENEGQQ
jgi:hypothetical protein